MKSVKTVSNTSDYAQLLSELEKAQTAYDLAKAAEVLAKHQLKEGEKKGDEDVLKLKFRYAKHNRKAFRALLRIAKFALKNAGKSSTTETSTIEAPAPKKRGRQPKSAEAKAVKTAEKAAKKRGRQPKAVATAVDKSAAKKRGRQPKAVEVKTEVIVATEAPAPKKRGRQPKAVAAVVDKPAPKKRGRQPKTFIEDEEEGVAGASARAMMMAEIVLEKAPKVVKAKAQKVVKAKAPKAVKVKAAKVVKAKAVKVAAPKVVKEKAPKAVKVKAPKVVKEKAPKAVKVAAPKVVKEKVAKAVVSTGGADDLQLIEGVGPKVAGILQANGVTTFAKLATMSFDELKALMINNKHFLANPVSWARQAQLAADGKMAELEALKGELKGGK